MLLGQGLQLNTATKDLFGANPGGWHGLPRLSWGFAWFHRSSSKASWWEEWRGENPDVPVSYGNSSRRLNCRTTKRRLAWMNLACDIYLRVIILQLSRLNWHSLLNYFVIGSNYKQALPSEAAIGDWRLIEDWLFFRTTTLYIWPIINNRLFRIFFIFFGESG